MSINLAFVLAALDAEIAAAESRFADERDGGGEMFFRVLRFVFDDLVEKVGVARSAMPGKSEEELFKTERLLEGHFLELRQNQEMVAKYSEDIGRRDLPMGLMILIDAVASTLVPDAEDVVVHLEPGHAYSTSTFLTIVVVNLPSVDPANVLLSPILAHELAHVQFGRLADSFNASRASHKDALAQLVHEHPGISDRDQSRVAIWAEELYCDVAASMICGPSYLFALASSLAASAWSADSNHPPLELRVNVVLQSLRDCGWGEFLESKVPVLNQWLRSIGARSDHLGSEQVKFLTRAIDVVLPVVLRLAQDNIPVKLEPATSLPRAEHAAKHLEENLLPLELERSPLIEWEFVLAGWLYSLASRGDAPDAVALAPFDAQLNGMLTKTIELSRVVEVWESKA